MKRKLNFLENINLFSIHNPKEQKSLEQELKKVFGVHGFETTIRFIDKYGC